MKQEIAKDIAAINGISSVPSILKVVSEMTGMRFVTIARVTHDSWTACAVLDRVNFGLAAGGQLDIATTLCSEVRACQKPIIIDHASADPQYHNHHTPKMYGFESYIAVPIYRNNGEYFGNLCALDPRPHAVSDEKITSMVKLFAELISVQLEAEEKHGERQTALLNEQRTAEVREQFIAVLGHDLRSPLTSISLSADLLLRKSLDQPARSVVERIRRSCNRMAKLVDDLMDFARGRLGGGIPLDVREVSDLEADLRHVVSELQGAHSARVIHAAIDVDCGIHCDRSRVAQLLSNLLANALSHGAPDRPVHVNAASAAGTFTLSVTNEGDPIPPEKISRLFQPYSRPTKGMPQAGLGLGLYIVAEIARSHSGTIDVSSSATATTFTFKMPVRQTQRQSRREVTISS